jgi:S1-C subfamily serine protease
MYIRPSSYFSLPSPKYSTGLTLTRRNKSYGAWVVNGVVEDCNAHKAGIRSGDMILSINGKTIEDIDNKTLEEMSHNAERWTVKILRGENEIEVNFEKDVL